jgi:carbon-monoxide dehydrogenase large subunit
MVAASQAHGAIAQGARQALLEGAQFDSDSGQVLAGSFMDDALPRADDLVPIQLGFNPTRCTRNPLGGQGPGMFGAFPAITNAIFDALAHSGFIKSMVRRSLRVWRAMRAGKGGRDDRITCHSRPHPISCPKGAH